MPRTKICGISGLPIAMVPDLYQTTVYIKRKLRVWRVQKCIPLVGAKTALTCAGLKTTPSDVWRYRLKNGNSGLHFTMVPCLHHSNVHIERKLREWREKKCIILVGAKAALTCAGLQTTMSHVRRYRAVTGNFQNFWCTFHHGTTFAPKQSLYQKEATGMESPKIYSSRWWKNRTYLCGPENYPVWYEAV